METVIQDKHVEIVPDGFASLVEHRRRLSNYVIVDDDDKIALSQMWAGLADEFEKIGYSTNAWMCRRKAEHYGR